MSAVEKRDTFTRQSDQLDVFYLRYILNIILGSFKQEDVTRLQTRARTSLISASSACNRRTPLYIEISISKNLSRLLPVKIGIRRSAQSALVEKTEPARYYLREKSRYTIIQNRSLISR